MASRDAFYSPSHERDDDHTGAAASDLEAVRAQWNSKINQALPRQRTSPGGERSQSHVPQALNLGHMSHLPGCLPHSGTQCEVGTASTAYLTPPASAQMLKYRDGPSSSLSTPVSSAFPSPNDRTSYTTGCVDPTIDPSILGGAQALYQSQLDHLTNTGQLPSPTATFERLSFSSDYSDYFNSDAWEEPAEHSRGGQYDASNYPMGSGPLWQSPLYEMEEDMFAPRDSDYPSPALDHGTEEETTKEVKDEPLATAFSEVESGDTSMTLHGGTDEDEDTATSLAHSPSDKPSKQLKKRPSGNLDLSRSCPPKNELLSPKKRKISGKLAPNPRAPPPTPDEETTFNMISVIKTEPPSTPIADYPTTPSPIEEQPPPRELSSSPLSDGVHSDASEWFPPEPPSTRTRAAARRVERVPRVSSSPELRPVSPSLANAPHRAGDRRMSQNRSAQKKYRDKNRRLLELRSEFNRDTAVVVEKVKQGFLSPAEGMQRLTHSSQDFSRNVKDTCAMTWARYEDDIQSRL